MKVNVVIPGHLHLICRKCTRESGFAGETREEAEATARKAGWMLEPQGDTQTAVCPTCPAYRPPADLTTAEIYAAHTEPA